MDNLLLKVKQGHCFCPCCSPEYIGLTKCYSCHEIFHSDHQNRKHCGILLPYFVNNRNLQQKMDFFGEIGRDYHLKDFLDSELNSFREFCYSQRRNNSAHRSCQKLNTLLQVRHQRKNRLVNLILLLSLYYPKDILKLILDYE